MLRSLFAFIVFIIVVKFLYVLRFQEEFQIVSLLPTFDIASGQLDNNMTGSKTENYYARFNCGSIDDNNGTIKS